MDFEFEPRIGFDECWKPSMDTADFLNLKKKMFERYWVSDLTTGFKRDCTLTRDSTAERDRVLKRYNT